MAQPFDGGPTKLAWTPTIQAAAYAANACVGNKFQVTDGLNVADIKTLIQSIVVTDADKLGAVLDVILFNDNPSTSTLNDKVAAALTVADQQKVVGVATISSWTPEGLGYVGNLAMPAYIAGGKSLFVAIVTRSAATWTTTSSISVQLNPIPAR